MRAAASLARSTSRKDRVGSSSFGGVLNWLTPATGIVQLYRIVDALLDTEIILSYAWKDIDVVPRGTLPPQRARDRAHALLDERAVGALLDLRARGFDLAVIEISPFSFGPTGRASDRLAYRLWLLGAGAAKYAAARGAGSSSGERAIPSEAAMEEVRAFGRHAPCRARLATGAVAVLAAGGLAAYPAAR